MSVTVQQVKICMTKLYKFQPKGKLMFFVVFAQCCNYKSVDFKLIQSIGWILNNLVAGSSLLVDI